jgi:hypothetical protein
MSAGVADQIRTILRCPPDWDYLLSESKENSITPLLHHHLCAVGGDGLPANQKARLKIATRVNAVRCAFLTAELVKILKSFLSHGIQAIPYKGPVLAAQAYGDVALREFEDLDIILRQRDLPKVHGIMLGLGYRPKYPWILSPGTVGSLIPGEYIYCDEARQSMVELHTELTLRHFPVMPDLEDLAERLVPLTLTGRDVQTISAEDMIPILCVHGSKHFWERLSWIVDISELLQASTGFDWDAAIRLAESLKAQRMLHLGLALAADLLEAPLPEEIRRRVGADLLVASIAIKVEERLLSREWSPLGATHRLHFRRRMVPGFMAGLRYATRLALIPAEEDWMMLRLPRPLAPLYMALRPLRLLHKYGWAGRRAQRLPM